ncbi:hypothetical protein [Methylocella silvestris]|uniref:hypothetical protein n=1 Tax=Methylocella silvestris TaxID=199596 RepID=UPI00031131F5|nr:hypothetical protein [Methylocella silvestris]
MTDPIGMKEAEFVAPTAKAPEVIMEREINADEKSFVAPRLLPLQLFIPLASNVAHSNLPAALLLRN